MIDHRRGRTATCLLAVLGLACMQDLTDPSTAEVALSRSSQGSGAEFVENPSPGLQLFDAAGNRCAALLHPATDLKSFLIQLPNGRQRLHIANHDVDITVTLASGEIYTGVGKLTGAADWPDQAPVTGSAVGRVSNGIDTGTANCHATRNPSGQFTVLSIAVH